MIEVFPQKYPSICANSRKIRILLSGKFRETEETEIVKAPEKKRPY